MDEENFPSILIAGRVSLEDKNSNKILIRIDDGKNRYLCESDPLQFIHEGDVVAFKSETVVTKSSGAHKNKPIYVVSKNCDIIIPGDEKTTLLFIEAIFNGRRSDVDNVILQLQEEAKDESMTLAEYLYKVCELKEEYNNRLDNLSSMRQKIYIQWKKNRAYRRMWHLGFRNSEIEEIMEYYDSSLFNLYPKIINNPLEIVPIREDRAYILCAKFNKQYSDDEQTASKIMRFIYKESFVNHNACVRKSVVRKKYGKDLERLRIFLSEHYGLISAYRCYYIPYNWKVESGLAEQINKLLKRPTLNIEPIFLKKELDILQKEAILLAINKPICLITGGPGRGKSTIIEEIVYNLKKNGVKYMLSGFTGRSVSRISEVVSDETSCMTLHMILTKLPIINHLIIDETSMVDSNLIYKVLSIYTNLNALTIIGDHNQLQPMKWGCFMKQLMKCNAIPVVRLMKNFRTNNQIITFDSNENIVPTEHCIMRKGDIEKVKSIYKLLLDKNVNIRDIQIITPKNEDVDRLNSECQQLVPKKEFLKDGRGRKFMIGDKVMLLENSSDDILRKNGMMGVVLDIEKHKRLVYIEYKNKTYSYILATGTKPTDYVMWDERDKETTNCLTHAYCVTSHKSQGGEWQYVIFYVSEGYKNVNFFNFYMINTSVTRTKIKLFIVGALDDIQIYVKRIPQENTENLSLMIGDRDDNTDGE